MICVFDKFTPQNRFNTCGERILQPLSCESTQVLNGDWSLTMEYLMSDKDDAWRYLVPHNIVRLHNGQLFPIYWMQRKVNSSGLPVVSIRARHIFYYLNDKITRNVEYYGNCYAHINDIFNQADFGRGSGFTDYDFTYGSNIGSLKTIKFDGCSIAYALMGAAESVLNLHNGELYRDNFYFSINDRMEGCRDNAFNLIHGFNLTEVSETLDYSEMVTDLITEDNLGHWLRTSLEPGAGIPHQVLRYQKLSYSDNDENQFLSDTDELYLKNFEPIRTYDVNFVDLRKTNKARDWQDIERLKIGDTGHIYSSMLGNISAQKIIQIKTDEISQRVKSMKLGDFKHNSMHQNKYDLILQNDGSDSRRINVLEAKTAIIEMITAPEGGE